MKFTRRDWLEFAFDIIFWLGIGTLVIVILNILMFLLQYVSTL